MDKINTIKINGKKYRIDSTLPPVTEADNGKVLMVVDGEWCAVTMAEDEPVDISFTITGTDMYGGQVDISDTVTSGTTWAEWCAEQNTIATAGGCPFDLWTNTDGVFNNGGNYNVVDSNGNYVLWDSEILAENYGVPFISPSITFTVEGKPYTAVEGTTWGAFVEEHSDVYSIATSCMDGHDGCVRVKANGKHIYSVQEGDLCLSTTVLINGRSYIES